LDILTLWLNVSSLPIGTWLGGLLAALIWRIGRRGGSGAANIAAALIGLATGPVMIQLAHGSLCWFLIVVIDAAIFWTVLLVGVAPGAFLLWAVFASGILMFGYYYLLAPLMLFAFIIGSIVASIAVMVREILRASLPEKSFNQLCSKDLSNEAGIGHVAEW
jgi:uncharacterized membrane protein